jgi:hypothetical protein
MIRLRLSLPFLLAAACALLAACASAPASKAGGDAALDPIAADYVRLTLAIGEVDPGYVDAYYGPAGWQAQAKAQPQPLPALQQATQALQQRLAAVDAATLSPLARRRQAFLAAQLTAAQTRLRMLSGEKLSFEDEARGLFGVTLQLQPLASYDARLADIAQLLPGEGPLWQRADALMTRTEIPRARLDAVMRAAIAECRRRTLQHIALPADERFTLEFVTGKPWSGYNWYQGHATSLIQVNTDLPVLMSRAVDLGCHEGYPGHHVLNTLLEEHLYKERGWIEFTVYPLYSPQSFLAEGSANFGAELAFSAAERLAFERDVLYPLAGLDSALAARDLALQRARGAIAGARMTIARDYLDGRIYRATALKLTQQYQLLSPARAEQSLKFAEHYRSYVINYGAGLEQVRAYVDAAGPTPEQRWAAMAKLLSEPTIPSDLAVPAR